MTFLETMRAFVTVRAPFRSEPVLIIPGEVDPERVESYVRQWCPDVVRRGNTTLEFPEGFNLLGPFNRHDDAIWPDRTLSGSFRTAYATQLRSTPGDDWPDDTRHFLLYGLARRLSGQVRDRFNKPWRDPAVVRAAPTVQAPRAMKISHEALLRLLASHYAGFQAKPEESSVYDLQGGDGHSDSVWLCTGLAGPSVFPLTRLRFSATDSTDIVEYEFEHDTTEPSDMRRMAEVAAAIAAATGGIMLDEDGFPWP